jgi:protoheme IX farnesyltransferase
VRSSKSPRSGFTGWKEQAARLHHKNMSRAILEIPVPAPTLPRWVMRAGIYLELSKARLCALVVATAAVGYLLGAGGAPAHWARFAAAMLGIALAAFAANAMNQVIEAPYDALMRRTRGRPLPSGRLGAGEGVAWSLACAAAGLVLLAVYGTALAAALAGLNIALYLLAYTPLKRVSPLNTLVGAVVGAIPPLIGWAAAGGVLGPGAWVLAATLFIWQMPHFLTLAFLARSDYARGGFAMLPSIDPAGRITARIVLVHSLALLPVTLGLALAQHTGWVYAGGAVGLGLWLVGLTVPLLRRCNEDNCRRLFLASIAYLPALLALLGLDALLLSK